MPSGWDVYYVVFLSALLALAVPAVLGMISSIFVPSRGVRGGDSRPTPQVPGEDLGAAVPAVEPTALGRRVNTRFFLGANAALILITLALALIPCVGTLQGTSSHQVLFRGLIALVSIAALAGLGLLYSARKGDLDWLSSHREGGGSPPNEGEAST
jgi:hypothetical protein